MFCDNIVVNLPSQLFFEISQLVFTRQSVSLSSADLLLVCDRLVDRLAAQLVIQMVGRSICWKQSVSQLVKCFKKNW